MVKSRQWPTPDEPARQIKRQHIIFVILGLVAVAALYPYKSSVIPPWRVRVVDVDGNGCPHMSAMEGWGHYSLFLMGSLGTERKFTDKDGYVEFPEREIRATGIRRVVMPIVTHILVIAHGSVGVSGMVYTTGLKDVAWLSYKDGSPLPDEARVEKCISGKEE